MQYENFLCFLPASIRNWLAYFHLGFQVCISFRCVPPHFFFYLNLELVFYFVLLVVGILLLCSFPSIGYLVAGHTSWGTNHKVLNIKSVLLDPWGVLMRHVVCWYVVVLAVLFFFSINSKLRHTCLVPNSGSKLTIRWLVSTVSNGVIATLPNARRKGKWISLVGLRAVVLYAH